MTMRVAVTGGAGLVGGAVIDRLIAEGAEIVALARTPAKFARWDGCVSLVTGDLADARARAALVDGADGLVHCAGVTHARADSEYDSVNRAGAAAVAAAAAAAGARMVHASSISARLPDASPYARSKRDSEAAVAGAHPGAAILRLPAIYGPRDVATLPYFKMIKAGLAAEPATTSDARASLLYVDDAAAALLAAMRGAPAGVYDVGDDSPDGRSWREIGALLGQTLGVVPRRLRAPRALLEVWHGAARLATRFGAAPSVRTGQLNEFFHPDWVARDNLLSHAIDWRPRVTLEEGFAKTALWYQKTGLLSKAARDRFPRQDAKATSDG